MLIHVNHTSVKGYQKIQQNMLQCTVHVVTSRSVGEDEGIEEKDASIVATLRLVPVSFERSFRALKQR